MNEYIELLKANKNIIFTGAPGTGKTYLAKEIANEMTKQKEIDPVKILQFYYKNKKEHLEEYYNKCENLRNEFLVKFPIAKLKDITLEDYCIGRGDKYNFCWYIERGLVDLGRFFPASGSELYLIYYSKEKNNYSITEKLKDIKKEDIIKNIGDGIYEIATTGKYTGNLPFIPAFIMKIAHSYNKGSYFPIFSNNAMQNICNLFNIEKNEDAYKMNKNLLNYFENIFKSVNPIIVMRILADNFNFKDGMKKTNNEVEFTNNYSFVQFHPSYDYTNFVEGLRPVKNEDNKNIGFELKYGIFKEFCIKAKNNPNAKYVFIIDEINRGEISKIFGELFYSIDPEYRGKKGRVKTQYSNLTEDEEEKEFYVPENVYIIGTMNDIDRSVESMDFAIRRRFAWKEIKANDGISMWEGQIDDYKNEAEKRMKNLNKAIEEVEGLSNSYHIGPAYFLKLKDYRGDFTKLWDYHINGLLFEYLRGVPNVKETMDKLKDAYDLKLIKETSSDTDNGEDNDSE